MTYVSILKNVEDIVVKKKENRRGIGELGQERERERKRERDSERERERERKRESF